jgi:formate-dependent nitrite reductase membrane component NrfD
VHLVLHQFTNVGGNSGGQALFNVLAVLGIIFAVGTMAYTGILLGASKGIPFWRSGVVPVIFVISATVTGHFAIMLGMVFRGLDAANLEALRPMALEAIILVVLEVLAIVFFLQAAFHQPDPRESAERILRKAAFVVGYFIIGLALPLILMIIVYTSAVSTGTKGMVLYAAIGALLGLIGGLILRWAVLICGALPTLSIAGFKFRRIHRPKQPKPGIGMMPPS